MRKSFNRTLVVLLLLILCRGMSAQYGVKNFRAACSWGRLKDSARVGTAVFNSYASDVSDDTCLQVFKDGKVVFRRTNSNRGTFTLGQKADAENSTPAIRDGTDITGHGAPNMIVSQWDGLYHCCLTQYVFEVGRRFRLVAAVKAEDDFTSHFAELDANQPYYDLTTDWTFRYWSSSYADSPHVSGYLALHMSKIGMFIPPCD